MYTSFTQLYFQKPIELIDEADLTNFFSTEQEETLMLEFKSFTQPPAGAPRVSMRDREEAIFKTLCAFANSGGGLLIWGAPREEKSLTNPKTTVCKGALQSVPDSLDRDSFIRKIASSIDPRPQGLRMHRVQVNGGAYVYLFEMQESQNKPHQVKGTYYVRIDTETNIAPHYLVYALCRQIKVPELNIEIQNENGFVSSYGGTSNMSFRITFDLLITNTTDFVNDQDVYIKLSASQGTFWVRPNPEIEKEELYIPNVVNVLSKGLPYKMSVIYNLEAPLSDDICIKIWYGGRNSSAKSNAYNLVTGDLTGNLAVGFKYSARLELI